MTAIKNLVFDLDKTLYPVECDNHTQFTERVVDFLKNHMQFDEAQIADFYNALKTAYHNYKWFGALEHYHIPLSDFWRYVCNVGTNYFPANPELCQKLSGLPYHKYILTDSSCQHVTDCLKALQVSETHFEAVCDSLMIGSLMKYNISAYRRIVEMYKLNPEECMMFEDNLMNLKPAKELGMTTVLITNKPCGEDYIDYQFPDINTALSELFS